MLLHPCACLHFASKGSPVKHQWARPRSDTLPPLRIWRMERDDRFSGFRYFCDMCGAVVSLSDFSCAVRR